ncbi:MAG: hypothetical protein IIB37_03120 [Gemmatimonadetes bacterium]|nr:hypothetical protein [Gemmatimonadota bacterium]
MHPSVEDFGCEPVRSPLPSGPPSTLPRRMPSNVEWSLGGRPTEWPPAPESACELEPYRPRVVSPGSGWERPCVLATGSKFEIVYWERIESPVPAVLKELNGSPLPSATGRSGVAPLSKEWAPWR